MTGCVDRKRIKMMLASVILSTQAQALPVSCLDKAFGGAPPQVKHQLLKDSEEVWGWRVLTSVLRHLA